MAWAQRHVAAARGERPRPWDTRCGIGRLLGIMFRPWHMLGLRQVVARVGARSCLIELSTARDIAVRPARTVVPIERDAATSEQRRRCLPALVDYACSEPLHVRPLGRCRVCARSLPGDI